MACIRHYFYVDSIRRYIVPNTPNFGMVKKKHSSHKLQSHSHRRSLIFVFAVEFESWGKKIEVHRKGFSNWKYNSKANFPTDNRRCRIMWSKKCFWKSVKSKGTLTRKLNKLRSIYRRLRSIRRQEVRRAKWGKHVTLNFIVEAVQRKSIGLFLEKGEQFW